MTKELIELGVSDGYLAELRKEWEIVPDCSETAGYNAVKLGLGQIRKTRTGIEKKRVLLTKPLLERKKSIDAEAKRLTGELVKIEGPLKDAKQAEDNRLELIRQEEIRKEAKRQERITAKIQSFGQLVFDSVGGSADDLEHALDVLRGTDTEDCDERREVADKTLAESIEGLEAVLVARRAAEELKRREAEIAAKEKAQEEEAARQKKKAEELAAEEARQKALDEAREEESKAKEAEQAILQARAQIEAEEQPPPNIPASGGFGSYSGPPAEHINAEGAGNFGGPPDFAEPGRRRQEARMALTQHANLSGIYADSTIDAIINGDIPWVSWTGGPVGADER